MYIISRYVIIIYCILIMGSCSNTYQKFRVSVTEEIELWDNNVAGKAQALKSDYLLVYRGFEPFYAIIKINDGKMEEVAIFGRLH